MASRIHLPWQASFALLAAIWGCSFWWIKLGLTIVTPYEVAFGRLALGAITLLIICALTGTALPRGRSTWKRLLFVALFSNAIPLTLFAIGETHITSVLAGIINATTPLTTLAVVLLAYPEENPTRERVAGLLLGFVGVLVVLGVWQGIAAGELAGVLACVGAVCCYGISIPYVRRHLSVLPDGPIALATGQVGLGAVLLLPVIVAMAATGDGGMSGDLNASGVLGLLGLGVLGTGLAYILMYQITAAAGSTVAASVTYLTPVVAVIVGVAFLSESVTWFEPVGALLVLVGIAVSQGRIPLGRRASDTVPARDPRPHRS